MSAREPKPLAKDVKAAAALIAQLLGDSKYAIVGGAALILLGSSRGTEDVDFVVLKGQTKAARDAIKNSGQGNFSVDPKTRHTFYLSEPPVEIEILTPPGLFKGPFDENTETMSISEGGVAVQILHPIALLDAKCGAILGRATSEKKSTDLYDILYLLKWLAARGHTLVASQVPNVSVPYVEWFTETYLEGDSKQWTALGWTKNGFPTL